MLLAGDNFGCGSSREHAPWALTQYGFRAVISTSFADIFKGNSLKNSLLPIVVPADVHARVVRNCRLQDADMQVKVDLASQTLTLPNGRGRCSSRWMRSRRHACWMAWMSWATFSIRSPAIAAFEAGASAADQFPGLVCVTHSRS